MKKLSIFLVFLFTIHVATASLLVEPAKFEFVLNGLEKTTEAIRVTNVTQLSLVINVNAYDWDLNENGDLESNKLGTLDSTLSGHIQFNPRRFSIAPGQTQIVRVTITMPEEKPLERRSIIFFESEQSSFSGNIQTIFQTLIGTTIYATNKKASSSVEVLAFEHTVDDENDLTLHMFTQNTGEAHIRVNVSYGIYDLGNQLLYSGDVVDTVLLPEQKHTFHLPVEENILFGLYNVIGRITFTDTMNFVPFNVPLTISD